MWRLASWGQSKEGFTLTLISVYRLVLIFSLATYKLPPPVPLPPLQRPWGLPVPGLGHTEPDLPCGRDVLLVEVTE